MWPGDIDSTRQPGADTDALGAALDGWIASLRAVGGRSPLVHFDPAQDAAIDLSATHPGGMPQFITGKTTLLSNLIRDDLALRQARAAAEIIAHKAIDLAMVRGIEAIRLAVGLAEWRHNGEEYRGPVLLRPLAIRQAGRDFELKLVGEITLNPGLARALREQFQIGLDPKAFIALAFADGIFKPQAVIDRLRGLTGHIEGFTVTAQLLVSSFAEVGPALAADIGDGHSIIEQRRRLRQPIIAALAGEPGSADSINAGLAPAERALPDARPPQADRLLLDADLEQEQVIAKIASGASVAVTTLPGAGGTQTMVNALGALVGQNKRILVVSPRRARLEGIAARFESIGLPGLVARPSRLVRDMIAAIRRNEKAKPANAPEVDTALLRLRRVLLDYRAALGHRNDEIGVTVLEALDALTELSLTNPAPGTTARLSLSALTALSRYRDEATRDLIRAAELGQFRYGPADSPWYGAHFDSPEQATVAHQAAKRLNGETLAELQLRTATLIGQTRLRAPESVLEIELFLRLLIDVKESLDRFVPAVFDRPLTEIIDAVSPRSTLSGSAKRRLKKLAYEFVRPGISVTDMHASLVRIAQQRTLWQRYSEAGAIPEVPTGIADVQVLLATVMADLALLDGPLGVSGTDRQLAARPLRELVSMLAGLAAESQVLENLHERTALLAKLTNLGLEPLLHDLAERHVPVDAVESELELAWWQSALEYLLATTPALLGAKTDVIERLEADFRLVDEAHVSSAGLELAHLLAETWRLGIVDWPNEAEALRVSLRQGDLTAGFLATVTPHLARSLAPVWVASPYELAGLDDALDFDAVFLLDAAGLTVPEVIPALRRARQVVVVGDPVTQAPAAFSIAATSEPTEPAPVGPIVAGDAAVDSSAGASAFVRLAELLPAMSLTRSYRAGGEDLARLVNDRFYDGRIDALPWAGSYLGRGSLRVHHIDGKGTPDPVSGAVESVDSELARTLELVIAHATERPAESLMVVTASEKHRARVEHAVLAALAKRSDLGDFFVKAHAEPFTVLTLEQAQADSRDRVIFSVGFGLTPHGRLLSDLGSLSRPEGERHLAVAMTRARRSLDLVLSFSATDIDPDRQGPGARALAEMLAARDEATPDEARAESSDALLGDLASRLRKRGIAATLDYHGKLALAVSYQGKAAVVETDRAVGQRSLRESLRQRPAVLRRLGWHYIRVHSFDLFANPQAVVERVARVLGAYPEPVKAGETVASA